MFHQTMATNCKSSLILKCSFRCMFKVMSKVNKSPEKLETLFQILCFHRKVTGISNPVYATLFRVTDSNLTKLFYIPPSLFDRIASFLMSADINYFLQCKSFTQNFDLGNKHMKLQLLSNLSGCLKILLMFWGIKIE